MSVGGISTEHPAAGDGAGVRSTRAQVQDLAPTVSRVYPGRMAGSSTSLTNRATPSTTPRTPDTAAAACRFRPCRSKDIWPVAGDNTRTSRPRSTRCRRVRSMRAASAAPCSSGRATTGWRRRSGFRPAASCCAARAWATPAPVLDRHGTGRSAEGRRAPVAGGRRWSGHARADRRRVRRDGEDEHEAGSHRRLRAGRCAQLQSGVRARASGRATRSSCGASATRSGSTPSA